MAPKERRKEHAVSLVRCWLGVDLNFVPVEGRGRLFGVQLFNFPLLGVPDEHLLIDDQPVVLQPAALFRKLAPDLRWVFKDQLTSGLTVFQLKSVCAGIN